MLHSAQIVKRLISLLRENALGVVEGGLSREGVSLAFVVEKPLLFALLVELGDIALVVPLVLSGDTEGAFLLGGLPPFEEGLCFGDEGSHPTIIP